MGDETAAQHREDSDQEKTLEENERMSTVSTQAHFLKNKHAVIFGAGGAVGTAVAKELAAHGATVFLSGRAKNDVEQVVADITKDGGSRHGSIVGRERGK